MTFHWDRTYDRDQVAEFLPAFKEVHAEITSAGRYPYNDSFKGRIAGIEGDDEDTAIYLLQDLKRIREIEARVDAYLADGFEHVNLAAVAGTKKYARVVHYGFYMGGTGWSEWDDARLTRGDSGGVVVLPKGRRTQGHWVTAKVIVKR